MVDRIGPVNAVSGAPQYDGRWERQLRGVHQAMGSTVRPLGARTGVRPGTPTTTVTATSTQWTCQPFAGEADVESAAEAGAYPFAFDAVATGTMTPADGSNARIDIVYVQIDDPSEDASSTPAVTRKYLAGSAGSGVAPSPPVSRAFVIAQINVPKASTGSPSVTWVAPYTAAAGGTVPFNTKAELDLWTTAPYGQAAVVVADATVAYRRVWYFNGAIWTHSLNGSTPFAMAAGSASNSAGSSVSVTFPAGRFTVPPLVTMANTGATVSAMNASSITATGATMAGYNSSGTAISTNFMWVAVQMTATTAAG